MVQINFASKEINCKIVYYGPGMSGKTTNLEVVHQKTPGENKGELTCIATEGDRTLFFDFMPLNLGNIMGMNIKFQLYTVPGQVYYNSTRKLVLRGVDGVIFVADSAPDKMAENLESLENLRENLEEYGKDMQELPIVIQYNKQDLPNALSFDEMSAKLNPHEFPAFPGVASQGDGVFSTLKALSAIIIENISQKDEMSGRGRGRSTSRSTSAPPTEGGGATATATPATMSQSGAPTAKVASGHQRAAAHTTGHAVAGPAHETSGVATATAPVKTSSPRPVAASAATRPHVEKNVAAPAATRATAPRRPSVPARSAPAQGRKARPARSHAPQTTPQAESKGPSFASVMIVLFVLAFAATAIMVFLR
jgi:hypothetical protein